MNKYRLKYQKSEEARYISHLDFIRTIGRTFKRSKLPLKYTQGFNPHIIMTVALPISVGVLSDSEYMDIELTESINTSELIERINNVIPLGLKIIDAKKINENDKQLSRIESAKYLVYVISNDDTNVDTLLNMSEILVDKKTKKGITECDIRKDIRDIEYIAKEDEYDVFLMHLSAGSNANLKPETVLDAMRKYCNYNAQYFKVKRVNMYFENDVNIF